MDNFTCPRCGSTATETIVCQSGMHHAKEVCAGCGRYVRFVGKPHDDPGLMPDWLRALLAAPPWPATLYGTQAQVSWAGSLRGEMIRAAREADDAERRAMLAVIEDATWFIGNREKPPALWRWPAPHQCVGAPPEVPY